MSIRTTSDQSRAGVCVVAGFLTALGLVAGADAGPPAASVAHGGLVRTVAYQRRSRPPRVPPRPTNVDSSPTIATLKKALTALAATDQEYDGHREKAINHVGAAIGHLQLPSAKGKTVAAASKSGASSKMAKTKEASDTTLRNALKILFQVHHQLSEKSATAGQLKADAEVRVAISELSLALNPPGKEGKQIQSPVPNPYAQDK
jgi:hypothetical protein